MSWGFSFFAAGFSATFFCLLTLVTLSCAMLEKKFFSLLTGSDQSLIILNNDTSNDDYLVKMISEKLDIGKEDILFFSPEEGVEKLRENIVSFQLRPNRGSRKLFVVRGVDVLNKEQSNALLKTIEEPPGHGKIILIGRNKTKIIKTILSRCHIVRSPLAIKKNDRESILTIINSLTFKDFISRIKDLDRKQVSDLLEGGLEELRKKGLNKLTGPIFKELGKSLSLIESTNCSYKLVLERLYIFIKSRKQ